MASDSQEQDSRALVVAAQAGRIGEVVRIGRQAVGLTQGDLANRCRVSQSTISRIERSDDVRDVKTLRIVANKLQVPCALVGLADPPGVSHTSSSEQPVNRREFLEAAALVAVSAALPAESEQSFAAIRTITVAQRRLDGETPSRDLAQAVIAHLRMVNRKRTATRDPLAQQMIAARMSEIAGFSGWLHWDMHDLGSARTFYSTAIKAAASAHHPTLPAYMLGSLAALAVHEGNASEGLAILRNAATRLGPECPMIAVAWLSSLEAIAHADAHNEPATWQALDRAEEAVRTMPTDGAVPWPWVFQFDHEKVARHRITSAVRLGRPQMALATGSDVAGFLHTGHAKQRGLLQLDLAEAHLQSGEADEAFRMAIEAVDLGREIQSGRIIDRARQFRRHFKGPAAQPSIREFDDRIQSSQF
jgi:transcriptional regulator with XRE-family HTH domain